MNEFDIQTVPAITAATVYVVLFDSRAYVWDNVNSAFTTYQDANQANYAIALTETPANSGRYVGNFPVTIDNAGEYGATAFKQVGGSPAYSDLQVGSGFILWDGSAEITPPTNDQLCTVSYAASYLGLTSSETSLNQNLLNVLDNAATVAIQNYCRRNFFSNVYSEFYDGQQSATLVLNQYPVTALATVTYYPHSQSPVAVAGSYFAVDYTTGIIAPISYNNPAYFPLFPSGFQAVKVDYTAGYDVIPSDLQQSCGMLIKQLWIQRGKGLLKTSTKLGDYQATYMTSAMAIIDSNYGIMGMLNRYRKDSL